VPENHQKRARKEKYQRAETKRQNFLKCIAEIDKEMQPESDRESRESRDRQEQRQRLFCGGYHDPRITVRT
jgi:hypothetical protein